jgi:hypothetical protein
VSTPTAVGWDIHRKFSQLSVVQRSESGEICVVKRLRLEHADRGAMRAELKKLGPGTPVAMEGAFGWPWIADLLDELELEPHLGHPPAIKVLAKHEAKADRVDADRLGRFWLRGIFPECYLATPDVRQLRERLRYRQALVRLRSGMKNRVHAARGLSSGLPSAAASAGDYQAAQFFHHGCDLARRGAGSGRGTDRLARARAGGDPLRLS